MLRNSLKIVLIGLFVAVSTVQAQETVTATLPDALVGLLYNKHVLKDSTELKNKSLSSSSEEPAFSWESIGDLPKGLRLESDGLLTGEPKEAALGRQAFDVRVKDDSNRHSAPLTIKVVLTIKKPTVGLVANSSAAVAVKPAPASGNVSPQPSAAGNVGAQFVEHGRAGNANNNDKALGADLVKALIAMLDDDNDDKQQIYAAQQIGAMAAHLNDSADVKKVLERLAKFSHSSSKDELKTAAQTALIRIYSHAGVVVPATVSGIVSDEEGEPVPHAKVALKNDAGDTVRTTVTDENGKYVFSQVRPNFYNLEVKHKSFSDTEPQSLQLARGNSEERAFFLDSRTPRFGGEFVRTILGYEMSGASSSKRDSNLFADFLLDVPLAFDSKQRRFDTFGQKLRVWGNGRISSTPDPTLDEKSLSALARGLNSNFSETPIKNLIRSFEVIAGLEYRLIDTDALFKGFERGAKQRFSLSLIAGAGMTTPLSNRDDDVFNKFEVTAAARERYPQTIGKDFLAFVTPERDRFFRQYFAGVRLKTFYSDIGERRVRRYPGTFEFTFGQNEAVTGGRLIGGVMRAEGFFPLPINLPLLKSLYLFGTAQMKLSRPQFSDPLILRRAPPTGSLVDENTVLIVVPPVNRDHYRFGVGVDLVDAIRRIGSNPR